MRSYADAMRDCMALGIRRNDCEDTIRDRFVDGVFCDGTVIMNEAGSRCVPADTIDRVLLARAADPLPARVVAGELDAEDGSPLLGALVLAGMAALAVWVVARKSPDGATWRHVVH